MKKIFLYAAAAVFIFGSVLCCRLAAYCAGPEIDAECYFYGVKYLEKFAEKSIGEAVKPFEPTLPGVAGAFGILNSAAALLKDKELKEAIKNFWVSLKVNEAPPHNLIVNMAFGCQAGKADAVLTKLSGSPAGANKKFTFASGFSGSVAAPDFAVITNAETPSLAVKRALAELAAAKGVEEKTVLYKSRFLSDAVSEFFRRSMVSLLAPAYEKVEKFEIEVVDDNNGRINICFPDEAALLDNYEVIVGCKHVFDAMTLGNASKAESVTESASARYSAAYGRDMAAFFNEIAGLSRSITHEVKGKTLVFNVPGLQKYKELEEKSRKLGAAAETDESKNPVRTCLSNMKTIEGAVELFCMETSKIEKPVTVDAVVSGGYLKKSPECPEGGSYSVECKIRDAVMESFRVKCAKHGYMDEIK